MLFLNETYFMMLYQVPRTRIVRCSYYDWRIKKESNKVVLTYLICKQDDNIKVYLKIG